jgi:hypothetical protein
VAIKYCSTCKNEIEVVSDLCPTCGKQLFTLNQTPPNHNPSSSVPIDIMNEQSNTFFATNPKPKTNNGLVILIVLLLFGAMIYGVFYTTGVNSLKSQLLRDWSRIETSDTNSDVMFELMLDFDSDQYQYIFNGGFLYDVISTDTYRVISPNKIIVNEGTIYESEHTIEFDSDKEMMIVTPALTSTDSTEYWFNHGY